MKGEYSDDDLVAPRRCCSDTLQRARAERCRTTRDVHDQLLSGRHVDGRRSLRRQRKLEPASRRLQTLRAARLLTPLSAS